MLTQFLANTGTANVRNNLRPLLKKYDIKMESEKEIKSMEELYTVSAQLNSKPIIYHFGVMAY